MCGIAGMIAAAGKAVDVDIVAAMSAAIEHRGPDDLGYAGWRQDGELRIDRDSRCAIDRPQVAMVHRRLSIIDESEGGWQPMATPDRRFVMTYNGEIYNYIELRQELEKEGVSFRTQSDSEVLLLAFAHWGAEKTLPRLVGMFAFVILDTETRTATLARDPFGIKPLYHASTEAGIAFASEITAILEVPGVRRRVMAEPLYDYLRFGYTDRGADTLFDGIRHLPPGHYAQIGLDDPGRVTPIRYWSAGSSTASDIDPEAAASTLRDLFLESVNLHLRSDVPVGAALSGGIDSSAVVKAMRTLTGPSLDLHTFTFAAADPSVDESRWAEMSAADCQAIQHRVDADEIDLMGDLGTLIRHQGEPFGSTSIYAQYRVFRLVKENGIKVTLDGQGADEILAGYRPFIAARAATLIRSGHWIKAAGLLGHVDGSAGLFARAMRHVLPVALQKPLRALAGEALVPAWMDGAWLGRNGVSTDAPQRPVSGDVLRSELRESLTDRVLPALLRYQDRNAMAHSVESRVPFLTTKLVEFVYSLPESLLIDNNGTTKSVFRRAMRGLVPDPILDRRDKIGFAAPEDTWLRDRHSWATDVLSSERFQSVAPVVPTVLKRMVDEATAGRGSYSGPIWRCLNFALWAEAFDVSGVAE